LLISLNELEKLKPLVQQKINELNSKNTHQQNGRGNFLSNNSVDFSPVTKQTLASNNGQIKVKYAGKFAFEGCSSPVLIFL
jgi:STAM-binding protein